MVEEMIGKMRNMRERLRTAPRPLSSPIRRELEHLTDEGIPIMGEARGELRFKEQQEGKHDFQKRSQLLELASLGAYLTNEYIKDSH